MEVVRTGIVDSLDIFWQMLVLLRYETWYFIFAEGDNFAYFLSKLIMLSKEYLRYTISELFGVDIG